MNSRRFTTKGELVHREWLASLLGMQVSVRGGIDLTREDLGIELKCRYEKYYPSFAVHAYQIDSFPRENSDKELFWAFLLYNLHEEPENVDPGLIEEAVSKRRVWFLNWDWVREFPVSYPHTGPYVYVKRRDFPPLRKFHRFRRGKGTLYVPPDTKLEERMKDPNCDIPF